MSETHRFFDQETHPDYNCEPGLAVVPGSRAQLQAAQFEQHHTRFTAGTPGPGNPYVYRSFPKMLYRAERYQGNLCCMAPIPHPDEYDNPGKYEQAVRQVTHFNEHRCQIIVKDATEYQRAMEAGWRESPQEALDHANAREARVVDATAERNYEDRHMSPRARAEAEELTAHHGGEPQPEITGRKVARARDEKRSRRKSAA